MFLQFIVLKLACLYTLKLIKVAAGPLLETRLVRFSLIKVLESKLLHTVRSQSEEARENEKVKIERETELLIYIYKA